MAGKGDVLRPRAVSDKIVEDNWARTFGSHRPKPPEPTKDDTDDAKPYLLFNRSGDTKPR